MADVEIKTATVPSLIGQAIYPRWWRHPLLWWKMRHLRADLARQVDPTVQALSADLERRFLFGVDDLEYQMPNGHRCAVTVEDRGTMPLMGLEPKPTNCALPDD